MRATPYTLLELSLLLGLIALGIAAMTTAAAADVRIPEREILTAVRDYVKKTADDGREMDVDPRWRGDLVVEGMGPVTLHPSPSNVEGTAGGVPVALEIRRGAKTLRSLIVTAGVTYYEVVAVSARPLRSGDPLTPDAVRFERRDVTQIQGRAFSRPEDLKSLRIRTMLPAGRILDRRMTEGLPMVRRGDGVTIRAQIGGVSVSTSGRALSDGAVGEYILVENGERQKIQGQVVGPGVVRVMLSILAQQTWIVLRRPWKDDIRYL